MSIKKVQPGPGTPSIVVRKGKPLHTGICPICKGGTVPSTNAKNQNIMRCGRCGAEILSTPF